MNQKIFDCEKNIKEGLTSHIQNSVRELEETVLEKDL